MQFKETKIQHQQYRLINLLKKKNIIILLTIINPKYSKRVTNVAYQNHRTVK